MIQRQTIEQKAEEALNSLDGLQRAVPKDWFYTRLKARLQQEETRPWNALGSFLSRPVVAIAGVCGILIMNVFFLLYQSNTNSPGNMAQSDLVESESIVASSSFDYENMAP